MFDKPKESCGVFGILTPDRDDAAVNAYAGLYFLQHRGQEGAGIFVAAENGFVGKKALGLLDDVIKEPELRSWKGPIAIGHVRYSTTGSNTEKNAQPFVLNIAPNQQIAVAHNGNLTNTAKLFQFLSEHSAISPESTTDTELIAHLIAFLLNQYQCGIKEAVARAAAMLEGAFSLVIMTSDELIALRDSFGFRPLILGHIIDDKRSSIGYYVASESCVAQYKNFRYIREIKPGEMIVIHSNKYESWPILKCLKQAFCIFEFIYFARPDSRFFEMNVAKVREQLGQILWEEKPADVDAVVAIPDSGLFAAQGYAEAGKKLFRLSFVRSHYSPRTFIRPEQQARDNDIYLKLSDLAEMVRGQRIVLIDDSIVRATTSKKILDMLYRGGAKEIHVRISSAPIKFPCFYGIDTRSKKELIAANKTIEEIKDFIGATTLGYLSLEGMIQATRLPSNIFCTACFNGDYPTEIAEDDRNKYLLEK